MLGRAYPYAVALGITLDITRSRLHSSVDMGLDWYNRVKTLGSKTFIDPESEQPFSVPEDLEASLRMGRSKEELALIDQFIQLREKEAA